MDLMVNVDHPASLKHREIFLSKKISASMEDDKSPNVPVSVNKFYCVYKYSL